MAIEFKSTRDVRSQGLFVLVHGRSGVGKTSLAKTIPGDEKILIISAEGGLLPLRGLEIDVYEIKTFADVDTIMAFLAKDTQYQWVFVDSLTEIAEKCLEAEARKGGELRKPGWDEYYWFTMKMEQFIKQLRDLRGLHVVLTALSAVDTEDERGKLMPVIPARKLRSLLSQFFDEVLYMDVDRDGKRSFITDCAPTLEAKDRSGSLANPEEPSLSVIVQKIYGGQALEREPTPDKELEQLLERIATGEQMIADRLLSEVESVREELWKSNKDLELATTAEAEEYYRKLRDVYSKLTGKDTGPVGDSAGSTEGSPDKENTGAGAGVSDSQDG